MYDQFEIKKLFTDQSRKFEVKLQHELAKKEAELRTHQRRGPLQDYQDPPAQVNNTRLRQTEYRIALTPEQFTIWIEMQRNFLMSQIQTRSQVMTTSTENTFQNSSQQIDLANSDVLQNPDRSSETEDTPVKHPKNTELNNVLVAQDVCESEHSVLEPHQKTASQKTLKRNLC